MSVKPVQFKEDQTQSKLFSMICLPSKNIQAKTTILTKRWSVNRILAIKSPTLTAKTILVTVNKSITKIHWKHQKNYSQQRRGRLQKKKNIRKNKVRSSASRLNQSKGISSQRSKCRCYRTNLTRIQTGGRRS